MKTIFFFIIFFSLFNFLPLYSTSGIITIQSTGISVIEDKIENSRKKAIDKAIINGIKKITDKNIEIIKKSAVIGYEILNESIEGNILKEKIKLLLNEKVLSNILNKYNNTNLLKIIVEGYKNEVYDQKISNYLIEILKSLPNYNIICLTKKNNINPQNTDYTIILKVTYKKIKELKTVNKIYANIFVDLLIYNRNMEKINELIFNKNIIYSKNTFYLQYLNKEILDFLEENLKKLANNSEINRNYKFEKYYFIQIYPKSFKQLTKLIDLFDVYNINYSWEGIKENKIIFIIKNFPKNKLIDILKTDNCSCRYKIVSK